MFTLPPLPPKDYVLKDVTQNQRSAYEFTPFSLPRITQSNLGKYCAPIEYQENEKLANLEIDSNVNPQLLEKWTDQARAFWVEKPGKNDYFLHDLFKKYSVQVVPSYDARFKHNERVFYRSFKYELECREHQRLQKLYRKMEREEKEKQEQNKIIEEKYAPNTDTMGVKKCKDNKPFWWRENAGKRISDNAKYDVDLKPKKSEITRYDVTNLRWQEEPRLTDFGKKDPCKRRSEMQLIGQPFRNEACNWYYNNYPPPHIRFIRNK